MQALHLLACRSPSRLRSRTSRGRCRTNPTTGRKKKDAPMHITRASFESLERHLIIAPSMLGGPQQEQPAKCYKYQLTWTSPLRSIVWLASHCFALPRSLRSAGFRARPSRSHRPPEAVYSLRFYFLLCILTHMCGEIGLLLLGLTPPFLGVALRVLTSGTGWTCWSL